MKPKNFPGRKNQRRIQALVEVNARVDYYFNRVIENSGLSFHEVGKAAKAGHDQQVLEERIVDPGVARNTRTKIRRTDSRKGNS